MITSVGVEQKWLPKEMGSLFLDCQDLYGLEYWYDIIEKNDTEVKTLVSNIQVPK